MAAGDKVLTGSQGETGHPIQRRRIRVLRRESWFLGQMFRLAAAAGVATGKKYLRVQWPRSSASRPLADDTWSAEDA